MFRRAITPELQEAASALSAAGHEYESAAAALNDELVIHGHVDNGVELRAALDKWSEAYGAHRSACHAFLRAMGRKP